LAGELKRKKIDVALSIRGDLRENLLVFLSGARERIGYGVTGGGFFLSRCLVYRPESHERRHTLDILRSVGVSREQLVPHLYFADEEERALEVRRREWGLSEDFIALQVSAGTPAKQWPRARFQEFLRLAAEKMAEAPLVFLGDDPADRAWLDDFLRKNPHPTWKNLVGQTTLRELLYLIRRCRLFIGHDSGPTHVAACHGIQTLFLYSGTNVFEKWRSLEDNADFLRHSVPCSPCHLTQCPVEGHPCMSGIEASALILWIRERQNVS
jgi:ADP-heptose:LPS heptosyltransferase